jgi:hypothetical protein
MVKYVHKDYGQIIEIHAPKIGGVRYYEKETKMIGFLEPPEWWNP